MSKANALLAFTSVARKTFSVARMSAEPFESDSAITLCSSRQLMSCTSTVPLLIAFERRVPAVVRLVEGKQDRGWEGLRANKRESGRAYLEHRIPVFQNRGAANGALDQA